MLLPKDKFDKYAFEDGARTTVTVYDCVVIPSAAVTVVVIKLFPTFNGMKADAVAVGTMVLLTVTVANGSFVVGVTAMVVTLFGTLAR